MSGPPNDTATDAVAEVPAVEQTWTLDGARGLGQPFDYQARFLTVYVRRGGTWQIVAEQSTEITG